MSKQLLCRYYAQGICNFGDGCMYSHDSDNSIPIPDEVCLFYLRSNCINGENCNKTHKSIFEIVNEANSNQEDENVDYSAFAPDENYTESDSLCESFYTDETINSSVFPTTTCNDNFTQYTNCNSDVVKSYASVASVASSSQSNVDVELSAKELCTFYESNGYCVTPKCNNIHGSWCDLCSFYSLHPFNEAQREQHRLECIQEHEKNMEESFAYQRSKDLACGICLDVVMEKETRKVARFGILENCLHVYCIECIRTWRNSNFDKKNKRGCPQCRIKSDFVIPSVYFYDDKEEKTKLINEYKDALSKQHCKYFKQGQGKCPFEGACFYKHEYPDGRKADLPMPSDRRRLKGGNGQVEDYAALLSLFMDVNNLRQFLSDGEFDLNDIEDFLFRDD